MNNNLIINKAGRFTHSFEDATISGLGFIIKPILETGTPVSLDRVTNFVRLSVEDNSDLNNPVKMLPPLFTLKDLLSVQTAGNLVSLTNIEKVLLSGGKAYYIPFDFTTNKVLKANQSIDVTVQIDTFDSLLEIQVVPIHSIGLETHKFYIEELELDNLKKRQKVKIGSGVDKILYQGNFGNLERVKIDSDILNFEKSRPELIIQSNLPFPGVDDYYDPEEPQVIASRTQTSPPLGDVSLELDFSSIETGHKLYILRKVTTPEVANNYLRKSEEHQSENLQKIRVTDLKDCTCSD